MRTKEEKQKVYAALTTIAIIAASVVLTNLESGQLAVELMRPAVYLSALAVNVTRKEYDTKPLLRTSSLISGMLATACAILSISPHMRALDAQGRLPAATSVMLSTCLSAALICFMIAGCERAINKTESKASKDGKGITNGD